MRLEQRRNIGANEGYPISLFQSCFTQGRGEPIHAGMKLSVGEGLVLKLNCNLVGKYQRAPIQKLLRSEKSLRRRALLPAVWVGSRRTLNVNGSGAFNSVFKRDRE